MALRSFVVKLLTSAFFKSCFLSFKLLSLLSCIALWLERSVYNRGVASSSPVMGILTVNFSTFSTID